MDQFEYVMVLVSIIVGLGVAHILLGVGGIIDRLSRRDDHLELSFAHAAWLANIFMWLVMFWWWEYRLAENVSDWTVGRYLFLVLYTVSLFLLLAVLVPRTWDRVTSLKVYFLERRAWFFSLLAIATILDNIDSYLTGGFKYILDTGFVGMGISVATIPVVIIGIRTTNIRIHNVMAMIMLVWAFTIAFVNLEYLSQ